MNDRMTNRADRVTTRMPGTLPSTILAKSIAGVALVALFAWIGLSGNRNDANETAAQAAPAAPVAITADRAAAHRREVFEERRARFEGQAPTQLVDAPQYP